MVEKWHLATGDPAASYYAAPKTMLETCSLVSRIQAFGKAWANPGRKDQKRVMQELSGIGSCITALIADRDHKFFARVANILQFKTEPQSHPLYPHILRFCLRENAGTMDRPCDPRKLLAYLKAKKVDFGTSYGNEFPSTLRKACNRIGAILAKGTIGAPRKSRHS